MSYLNGFSSYFYYYFFLISLIQVSCIDFDGQGRVFLMPFIQILLATIFLFFFQNFLRLLKIIKVWRSCELFRFLNLRFFNLGIFYWLTLGVGFGHGSVSLPKTSKTILIYFTRVRMKPECRLTFGFNHFFN